MADFPLVGKVSKRTLLIGGGASVVVVGFIYLRKRKGTAAAATTTDTTTTDTGAIDPNAIDPNTGLPYGDTGLQDTPLGPTVGATGYYDPNTGQWVYGNTGTGQAAATTNQQWAQLAEQYLIANNGADPAALSAAIGKYLTGQAVNASQESLIDQAIAIEGYPPTAGAGGYPPGIRTQSSGGQGGGGGGGRSTQVTVPDVKGQPQEAAFAILEAEGLKPSGTAVQHGHTLTVDSQSPKAGSHVAHGSTVTLHSSVHGASQGQQVTVPSVVHMEQAHAFSVISGAGLHPAGPRPVKGRTHTVISQSPKAGAHVAHGSTVTVRSKLS